MLSLRAKGFLFAGLPVVLLLFLITGLTFLWMRLQSEMVRENQASTMLTSISSASKEGFQHIYTVHFEQAAERDFEKNYSNVDKTLAAIRKRQTELLELSKRDPLIHEQVERFVDINKRNLEAIRRFQRDFTKPPYDREERIRLQNQIAETANEIPAVIAEIENIEERRTEQNPFPPEKIWKSAQIYLAAFLGVLAAFTLGFGLLFLRSIRDPIHHSLINSRRLSQREPLAPPLAGNDEFAELDQLVVKVSKEVYQALQRERELVENAAELICSLDEHLTFIESNQYAVKMLGLEPTSLVSRTALEFIYSDDCLQADEYFKNARNNNGTVDFELRLQHKDGHLVDTRWYTFWSESQKRFFCVVHDLTEEKNIERIKQDFVNMVSHDLRSPLMSMHGSLTMIAEGVRGPVPESLKNEATEAARSIELLNGMINDLLDFQKLQSGKMLIDAEELDLGQLVEESIEILRPIALRKRIEMISPTGRWIISADKSKLRQTIVNLLSNAIKFSPEGKAVRIEIFEESGYDELQILDNGPGVPVEYQEKIFDAFEQVPTSDKRSEGSGLGLAICKLIVTAHGGTLGVRNCTSDDSAQQRFAKPADEAPFTGSIFWLKLPLS